jgi:hypothetical protein
MTFTDSPLLGRVISAADESHDNPGTDCCGILSFVSIADGRSPRQPVRADCKSARTKSRTGAYMPAAVGRTMTSLMSTPSGCSNA